MRNRYHGKWYRNLTFTQKTTLPDGKVETWYEALELPQAPNRYRAARQHETILFRNESVYAFENGKLKNSKQLVVETEVLFLSGGEQKVKEEYSNPKANVKLNPAIFDPNAWTAPGWIR
jgi:hypothetical protein